uniref:Predicted nucleic acid-binding protein, contains PIN domain n=1 Tax=Candidatus Kentrum sp. TUN TaxID=2126343 RepID=A0A450ZL10_9GAMM|nr:MAG: Predicted nucleic acid-binding protein, contains PIN domain [Candidatus Kentron sp. TUN]VFK51340.1 MAG: Predicted nucleic acid-binding protein, contains PIN domain [Candidatus Kentron sp. TUN]VFK54462.1 MAG: Predicted nucleic acid-binding protein, contains PIN domain [Candidatus Kentron sp. TUN]
MLHSTPLLKSDSSAKDFGYLKFVEEIISIHELILLDSCILIYHIEQHPRYSHLARSALRAVSDGICRGIVSELTLMEIKTGPLRQGEIEAAGKYELLLDRFPNLSLIPIERSILDRTAHLRAYCRLKTPDAIILATGLERGATLALTNDQDWKGVNGIQVVCLEDFV